MGWIGVNLRRSEAAGDPDSDVEVNAAMGLHVNCPFQQYCLSRLHAMGHKDEFDPIERHVPVGAEWILSRRCPRRTSSFSPMRTNTLSPISSTILPSCHIYSSSLHHILSPSLCLVGGCIRIRIDRSIDRSSLIFFDESNLVFSNPTF